jgi:hypothetical protein
MLRSSALARERAVGKALAVKGLSGEREPRSIGSTALVEAKDLLIDVGVQMEAARRDIRSVKSSLQARPKFSIVFV